MVNSIQIKQQKADRNDKQSTILLAHKKKNQKEAVLNEKKGLSGHVAKMWYCSSHLFRTSIQSMLCPIDKKSNHQLFVTPLKFYFHKFFHPSTRPTFSHQCLIQRYSMN